MTLDPRDRLLQAPTHQLVDAPPELRDLADAIHTEDAAMNQVLDHFAGDLPFDPNWLDEARTSAPNRWIAPTVIVSLAAAVLTLAVLPTLFPPPTGEGVQAVGLSECGGDELQQAALSGELSVDQTECLGSVTVPSDRDAASRLLMVHHWAAGDRNTWRQVADAHLTEVDDGDAELVYKVVLHDAKQKDVAAAARWGLHLRSLLSTQPDWSDQRLDGVHKTVTAALRGWWQQGKTDGEASDELERRKRAYAESAQAWVAHRASMGRAPGLAVTLCQEASEDPSACE